MDLGVASWPEPGADLTPPTVALPPADGTPSWYRGDEVESQEWLHAMGVVLE